MRRSHLVLSILFVAAILLTTGCGRHGQEQPRQVKFTTYRDLGPPPMGEERSELSVGANGQRMIAKTAAVDAEVEHCDSALSQSERFIASCGGYVTRSVLEVGEAGRKSGSLTARVPASYFDTTLAVLPRFFLRVKSVRVEGADITDEFYDTVGRLENRRALEASYRALLGRAGTIQDLLEVQKALADVDDEIDKLEGKRQYLSGRAQLASIMVTLAEPAPPAARPVGVSSKLSRAAAAGIRSLGDVLATTLTVIVVGVPLVLAAIVVCLIVVRLIRYIWRKRRGRRQSATPS
jgi:hypothetical protein